MSRFCRFGGLILVIGAILVGASGFGFARAMPAVTGVRIGQHGTVTRLVFDLSGKAPYEAFTLADPYRVVIDLDGVDWRLRADPRVVPGGPIASIHHGAFRPGRMRVVFSMKTPVFIRRTFTLGPRGGAAYRIAVDLQTTNRTEHKGELEPRQAAREPVASNGRTYVVAPGRKPVMERRVVVIDAGHGGIDPGTIGTRGTQEKTITLALARQLAAQLEATGRYRAVLTRKDDEIVPLRERVRIARKAHADLFISIHANSIADEQVRGASVYTLSETASDKEAAALAAKENKADIIAGVDLGKEEPRVANILIDLAQRETMNLSARFARQLVDQLGQEVRLLHRTHRFAGFAVLKAPDVPSVLLELGYLSNPEDERQLRRSSYRAKVAAAIVRAIDKYFALTDRLSRS